MEPLTVGEKAPNFHLPATYARILDTKDFAGKKHLLMIFCPPGDSDRENTEYLCRIRDVAKEIKGMGVEIIGVSPSNQRFQSIFAYRNNLPFPFLIDERKECIRDFHALNDDDSVDPTTYVIDKGYVVRMAERGFPEVSSIVKLLNGVAGQ